MGKLTRIVTGVIRAQHNNVEVRRCYGSKISKGGFIKVKIGLTEPIRMGDMISAFLMGERDGRLTM
jgi:hypothetical protein